MTHEERRSRRSKIAAALKAGMPLATAIRKFKVTEMTIRNSCKENGVPFGRRNQAEVLSEIAADIKSGMTPDAVCKKHGTYEQKVRKACRENGVPILRRTMTRRGKSFEILLALLKRETAGNIGRQFGVSYEYVCQVADTARIAGFDV